MSTSEPTQMGVLEIHPGGHGFLRDPKRNFKPGPTDLYVEAAVLSKFRLKQGVRLAGSVAEAQGKGGPRLKELLKTMRR